MQVTILDLDFSRPQAISSSHSGAAGPGYWCRFDSILGSGEAIFVPAGLISSIPAKHTVEIMAGYESLSEFHSMHPGEKPAPLLQAAGTPGDFLAVGQVVSLVWLDEDLENSILEVQVGPLRFSIVSAEFGELDLDYGEWVGFRIHQLLLLPHEDTLDQPVVN